MRLPAFALLLGAIACHGPATSSDPIEAAPSTTAVATPPDASAIARDAAATDAQEVANALVADVARRLARAREDFGEKVPTRVLAGAFVLVAPDYGRLFNASAKLASDALVAFAHERFVTWPRRAVTVLVFSTTRDYKAYCASLYHGGCDTNLGAYHRRPREIIVDAQPGLATLTHEIVHPLVEADFAMAPTWFEEGLASLFENPIFPAPGEIHGATNWRKARLLAAIQATPPDPRAHLGALFGISDAAFRGDGGDTQALEYAVARYVCQWLDERGKLWPFYRAWREGFWDDLSGEKAFAKVVGETPRDAEAEWEAWVVGR